VRTEHRIPYGRGIRIATLEEAINFCLGFQVQASTTNEEIIAAVEDKIGWIPGLDEYLDLKQRIAQTKMNPSVIWDVIREEPWMNLEELRTIFGSKTDAISENTIRAAGGFPARYLPITPRGILYELADSLERVIPEKCRKYYHKCHMPAFNGKCEVGEDEVLHLPIQLRIGLLSNRQLLYAAKTSLLMRDVYHMDQPTSEMFLLTPRHEAVDAVSRARYTPHGSLSSDSAG
jgi:hypothetical protein